ncbi:hypothetical protein [Streptomyces sp. WAC06614]|uniref:hypothetical protein n=1 Tax=Streptomyces sp. WAC06614 TaxID=2487416 RepID=UPI000F78A7C2|nr:hypothetical protein [Streptomyces sp. WAC06614]RSS78237.1 hypothetical protein EF918_21735 [Streptomyces sp. WAC06614]
MTEQAGSEPPVRHLHADAMQTLMDLLPPEDRGRLSLVDKAQYDFVATQPRKSPAGEVQQLREGTAGLPYRTLYTQKTLDNALQAAQPLHFAPGAGPAAEVLVLRHEAVGGEVHLYGGFDQQPLLRMEGGRCRVEADATIVDLLGGVAHVSGGTIVNKRSQSHSEVQDGWIENMYAGSAGLNGTSWCSTVHGGHVWVCDDAVVGAVTDGTVALGERSRLVHARGGHVEAGGTSLITEVSGGIVHLQSESRIQMVIGGTVRAYEGSTVDEATGGVIHAEDGATVTAYRGATVHLHGTQVNLTDHGATVIQET